MSDEHVEEQGPSVFGNLPASRPGTRSPRRASEAVEGPHEPLAAGEPPEEPEPLPADDRAPEAAAAEGEQPDEQYGPGAGGLEDLAWGGVAVAAEAATLGVKLATRAVEALRDAASRR